MSLPESVGAYDLPERVSAYDRDMDLMHPLRRKMAAIILELLPFPQAAPVKVLDLGSGTGFLTGQILAAWPNAEVVAVDGAASMTELARARLAESASRVRFAVADFRELPADLCAPGSLDAVVSAYALHHLTGAEKRDLIARALPWLRPQGWFLNADLTRAAAPAVEQRIQQLRVGGILERRAGDDPRFLDEATTRAFLDEMEAREQDRPQLLADDIATAREAGLDSAEVFWKEYREAVWGGPRAAN